MIKHCSNCKQNVEARRVIGVGSLLLAIFTCGIWLAIIPFYQSRCPKCKGNRFTKKKSNISTKCPFCAEEIKPEAIKCKHCGEQIVKTNLNIEPTSHIEDQTSKPSPKSDKQEIKRDVYLMLNGTFGVILLLSGVITLFSSPLRGLCLVVMSALLLPPLRKFIYQKTNKKLTTKARSISLISIFMVYSFLSLFSASQSPIKALDRKAQEDGVQQVSKKVKKAAKLRQERIGYFNANREQIISSLKKTLSEKNYQSVISQTSQHLITGDSELLLLKKQAEDSIKAKTLVSDVKKIPSAEYEKNYNIYKQLVELQPENKFFKKKHDHYLSKLVEENKIYPIKINGSLVTLEKNISSMDVNEITKNISNGFHESFAKAKLLAETQTTKKLKNSCGGHLLIKFTAVKEHEIISNYHSVGVIGSAVCGENKINTIKPINGKSKASFDYFPLTKKERRLLNSTFQEHKDLNYGIATAMFDAVEEVVVSRMGIKKYLDKGVTLSAITAAFFALDYQLNPKKYRNNFK